MAETVNGLCKTELTHRRAPWKTKEALELANLELGSLVQPPQTAELDWVDANGRHDTRGDSGVPGALWVSGAIAC